MRCKISKNKEKALINKYFGFPEEPKKKTHTFDKKRFRPLRERRIDFS